MNKRNNKQEMNEPVISNIWTKYQNPSCMVPDKSLTNFNGRERKMDKGSASRRRQILFYINPSHTQPYGIKFLNPCCGVSWEFLTKKKLIGEKDRMQVNQNKGNDKQKRGWYSFTWYMIQCLYKIWKWKLHCFLRKFETYLERKKKKWTNKGNDLLHNTTINGRIKRLYHISNFYLYWFLRNLWHKSLTETQC